MVASSLILGVLSIILGFVSYFICGWLSFIALTLGIVGLILGNIGRKRGESSMPGFICSIVGTSISGIGVILYIILLSSIR